MKIFYAGSWLIFATAMLGGLLGGRDDAWIAKALAGACFFMLQASWLRSATEEPRNPT